MSAKLRRPPAINVVWPRTHTGTGSGVGIQNYGAVDQSKRYAGAYGGSATLFDIVYYWMDLLQINPAHSQPKLILYSAAQPFIRTGHMRRFSRTFMTASPRFFGRWAYVGAIERQYTERARMTGVPTRLGTTYVYPRFTIAPRAVQLGHGGSGTGT